MGCSRQSFAAALALAALAVPVLAPRMLAQRAAVVGVPALLGFPLLLHAGSGGGMRSGGQGFLGVGTRTVGDPVLVPLHLKDTHGVCVVAVDHDSPAWKAGIREHDVLLSLNSTSIENEEQLARMLRDMPPGRVVQVVLSREGAQQTVSATLADRDEVGKLAWEQHFVVPAPADIPDDTALPPEPAKTQRNGFAHNFVGSHLLPGGVAYTGAVVDEIGPQLAEYFGLKTGKGLLVHSVDANSPAANAGLHAGDVVCRVNGQSVATRSDWTHALHDSKGHPVSVTVMHERHEQTLTIVPDGKRRSEAEPENNGEHHWLAVLLVRPRF